MKRALKALLLAGAMTAVLAAPAVASDHPATCVGIWHQPSGESYYGAWTCDYCPSSLAGLGDGRLWVVTCFVT